MYENEEEAQKESEPTCDVALSSLCAISYQNILLKASLGRNTHKAA
jgi:hypothetical protein